MAIGCVEGEAKDGRADQYKQNKRSKFRCVFQGLFCQGKAQAPFTYGQNNGTQRTHGATFCRGRNAQENGSKHQENQNQGRKITKEKYHNNKEEIQKDRKTKMDDLQIQINKISEEVEVE
jgi:hypothetical protein